MNEITVSMRNTTTGKIEDRTISHDNSTMALGALEQFSFAYENNHISIKKSRKFKDIVFHYDNPMGQKHRYTFGLVDPETKQKILGVAVCVCWISLILLKVVKIMWDCSLS